MSQGQRRGSHCICSNFVDPRTRWILVSHNRSPPMAVEELMLWGTLLGAIASLRFPTFPLPFFLRRSGDFQWFRNIRRSVLDRFSMHVPTARFLLHVPTVTSFHARHCFFGNAAFEVFIRTAQRLRILDRWIHGIYLLFLDSQLVIIFLEKKYYYQI